MAVFAFQLMALLLSISIPFASASPDQCAKCHQQETAAWQQSHHAAAMAEANPDTVLAALGETISDPSGTRFTLHRDDDAFSVTIVESDGRKQRLPVHYTFGVYPLQQYLVAIAGGRYQALPVAFDTRDKTAGGQRWFALDTDLHWRSFGFNWNTSCADCHSTGLQRNYDAANNRFTTDWSDINVSCSACHADADGHNAWLQAGKPDAVADAGFAVPLPRRGEWRFVDDASIATRSDSSDRQSQLPMCARCHAHRSLFSGAAGHPPLPDQMMLSLLEPGLYHSDGQIREEVYVTGSFLQSKMHAAGVVCSDCHEPHSQQLRAPGNDICAQCHRNDVFDQTSHHGHPDGSSGADCANCHMPATVYMGVDPRRDHRFGIPDPTLTGKYRVPNACADCHTGRGDRWIEQQFGRLFPGHRPDRYAHTVAATDAGSASTLPALLELATDPDLAPIKRASALLRLPAPLPDAALRNLQSNLQHADALVRLGALRTLQGATLAQQRELAWPHLQDAALAVRMEASRMLAPLLSTAPGTPALAAPARQVLLTAVTEYRQQQRFNADHPAAQMNLAISYEHEGRAAAAIGAYRQALRIEPDYVPALLNLAQLQRQQGDTRASRELLEQALSRAPDNSAVQFAVGLQRVRDKNYEQALAHLQDAARLEPRNIRYSYTLAVAQEQTGDIDAAIATLRRALGRDPRQPALLGLVTNYSLRVGKFEQARRYLARWQAVTPDDPQIRRIEAALNRAR